MYFSKLNSNTISNPPKWAAYLNRRCPLLPKDMDGPQAQEKKLNIIRHEKSANQNHNEIPY